MAAGGNGLYLSSFHKAELEARNGVLQFYRVIELIQEAKTGFRLTPAVLLDLHKYAIQDIYTCAGKFRTGQVYLSDKRHTPPPADQVPGLVEQMCNYVNENWEKSPVHLSAYLMWRHNWIHPFFGGNGRTSRALSYLVLCAKLEFVLPGKNTIPQQIERDRNPYFDALHSADDAWKEGGVDVSAMEELVSDALAAQLLSIHQQAMGLEKQN
jgi:Fic family protein